MANGSKGGGSAFPKFREPAEGGWVYQDGMSLRDWFAGQALNGICASEHIADHAGTNKTDVEFLQGCARRAFMFADAMLAERQKP